jgi:hypothetical protein
MQTKKLKIENPVDTALQFISNIQIEQEDAKSGTNQNSVEVKPIPIQDKLKTDKKGKELKRKRYNLLLIPSIYNDIERISYVENISVNEAINRALELYRITKKDSLVKYDEIEKLKSDD